MRVTPIPALVDNYAWLLVDGDDAVVVDPSDAQPVLAALGAHHLRAVWCTHHHGDHVGGLPDLLAACGPVEVVASHVDRDRIPGVTRVVREGDVLDFGGARVLEVPGHTLGAVAYVLPDGVFSGDTLFSYGCGRVFEGTIPMLRDSLAKLRELDGKLWCGHEYTVKNLRFGVQYDSALLPRLREAQAKRGRREPTVPSELADERRGNPFLRWDDPALAHLGEDVFAVLREARNRF
ncbi:MAG: hydroxyacylglutathione hydrolase [Myxococcota bacterium]